MSTTVSARIDDPEIVEALESADTKSEDLREALRQYYGLQNDNDLPEILANAYEALLVLTDGGDGLVTLSVAKKTVPQFVTRFDKLTVVDAAFRPLQSRGYIEPVQRIDSVDLYVRSAEAVQDVDDEDETMTDQERERALLEGDYEVEGSA